MKSNEFAEWHIQHAVDIRQHILPKEWMQINKALSLEDRHFFFVWLKVKVTNKVKLHDF